MPKPKPEPEPLTLERAWQEYRRIGVPVLASIQTLQAQREAFLSGAYSLLMLELRLRAGTFEGDTALLLGLAEEALRSGAKIDAFQYRAEPL